MIELYRADKSEFLDIQFLKKDVHGYRVAYFPFAFLKMCLKTMLHSFCELQSAVTLLNKFSLLTLLRQDKTKIHHYV